MIIDLDDYRVLQVAETEYEVYEYWRGRYENRGPVPITAPMWYWEAKGDLEPDEIERAMWGDPDNLFI